jgi:hypothetical protein
MTHISTTEIVLRVKDNTFTILKDLKDMEKNKSLVEIREGRSKTMFGFKWTTQPGCVKLIENSHKIVCVLYYHSLLLTQNMRIT